ncbi:MAG TPA: sigma 54-interacting transcriptional regulator [Longimicrobiales bacterium]
MAAIEDAAGVGGLIGQSPAIARVRALIHQIGNSPVPVLIVGETGTGKELCAAAIAGLSDRKPYIPVNCATFSETLVDSELFGHDRGAFTGAIKDHPGIVGQVDGGILFLDELAETPLPVQAKLLRTLESGEYRRVGGTKIRRSRFRLLAATNGNPEELVAAGKLRADLVYRLGAIRIVLPPLRDRLEDIPLLVDAFLRRYRERAGTGPLGASADAYRILADHSWPGNIRELRNVIEAAAALAGRCNQLGARHVSQVLLLSGKGNGAVDRVPTLAEALNRAEARVIREALRRADDNRTLAAQMLGISEATLYRKLAKHHRSNWLGDASFHSGIAPNGGLRRNGRHCPNRGTANSA